MKRYGQAETLRDSGGAGRGPDADRWPGAPPQPENPESVRSERPVCPACDWPSTLSYRCSECGYDLAGVEQ